MKLKKAIIVTLLLMLTFNFNIGKSELVVGSDIDDHIIEIL